MRTQLCWLGALTLLVGACRKTPATQELAPTVAPSLTATASVKPPRGAPSEEEVFRPDEPEAAPLALAPAPSSAGAEERSQRLKELLNGQVEAVRLPLAATDPGVTFEPALFHGLTTEAERPSTDPLSGAPPPPRFRVDVGQAQLLSGNIDPKRLSQAVSERRGGFRLCYQDALNDKYSNAQVSAKVVALFDVDADGRPASIRADGDAPKALFECVKKHGMGIALQPAPGALRFRIAISTTSTD